MLIEEVNTRKLLRQFVIFPDKLYRNCPQYVPALHSEQIHSLTECASLDYCTHVLFLARAQEGDDAVKAGIARKGDVVGRISAFINPRYNELYGKKCCRFGWFDCIEDFSVAQALITAAEQWARSHGMNQIHGPLYYNTLGKQGMLVEGFDKTPQFNTLYNYPYYVDYMERLGFVKECDWVQYIMYGWHLPERLEKIADRLQERYRLHFENIEKIKKDPEQVHAFLQLYSDTFARSVYNFIPFTEKEMEEEAKGSISMLKDSHCNMLYDDENNLAGFGINFPSISKALQKAKGSLFPFGWFHLLKAIYGKNDTVDLMINGTAPKWSGKGLSAVYHKEGARKLGLVGVRYSISNPQIETNQAANVWSDYSSELYMRRRCFIKDI